MDPKKVLYINFETSLFYLLLLKLGHLFLPDVFDIMSPEHIAHVRTISQMFDFLKTTHGQILRCSE